MTAASPPGLPDQTDAPTEPRRGARGLATWQRRTIIGVIVVLALGFFIWSTSVTQSGGGAPMDGAIVSLSPPEDAQALHQTSIGAELQPGYDGRLTIDGVDIPEDQMDGAIDPSSVTPDELARYGIRPNNKNRVFFTPGPGKVIEELRTGPVTVVLHYFKDKLEASTSQTLTWSFRVD